MKRWQDIIDRLKEKGDWEAAATLRGLLERTQFANRER